MAPKAKVKAAPKANVQSKDMVKSVSKDKKVGKGKAKCQAKAKAQGKAQGKATAKAGAKGAAPDSSQGAGSAGWDCIQAGKSMGQLGAQAVKYHLQRLNKAGNPGPLVHYEGLKGHKAKLEFALSLKLDREASFLSAQECHKASVMEEDGMEEGWLTEAQVAAKEGLSNYTKDDTQLETLKQILEGLPQRPHKDPWRAAKDHKQYHYSAETLSRKTSKKESSMEVSASVGDISKADFDMQVDAISGGTCVKTMTSTTKNRSLPKDPNHKPKEMTEEEKAKVDLVKNAQKNLGLMERDQRTFIRLAAMDKSKLPASLHLFLSKYQKSNTSHITTLVNTLDEIKPLDPNDVDTDHYQKVLDQSMKAREDYLECMRIGEALLKM
jgi:hypothetical protein